jgi:tellurite resistance protein TehA-like permease
VGFFPIIIFSFTGAMGYSILKAISVHVTSCQLDEILLLTVMLLLYNWTSAAMHYCSKKAVRLR